MKIKLLFIAILITHLLSAQTWKYKSGGNAFDGKYRTASVEGKGNDYPYNDPVLVINLFNEESLNFYITNAGYFPDVTEIEILWILSDEKDVIYSSTDFTLSDDSKTIFLSSFINTSTGETMYKLEFIEKLKLANKVDVRVRNNYGKNDINFSLLGSSIAIDNVITNEFKKKRNEEIKAYKKQLSEEIERKVETKMKVLKVLEKHEVLKDEQEAVLEKIEYYFDLYDLDMNEIDSLKYVINSYSGNLELFNVEGNLVKKLTFFETNMPKSFEVQKKKMNARENESTEIFLRKIPNYFESYSLSSDEINSVTTIIREKLKSRILQKAFKNNLEIIDSVSITSESSTSKDFGKVFFWGIDNEVIEYSYASIPEEIMEKIELKNKNDATAFILRHIKKYELSEEENNKIIDNALITIKIFFKHDLSKIKNIELELSDKYSRDVEIRINKLDGSLESSKLYNDKNIWKKVKKFQD